MYIGGTVDPKNGHLIHHTEPHNHIHDTRRQVDAVAKGVAALPPATLQSLDLYDPEAQRLLRVCNWQAYLKDPPPEDDAGCGCS